MEGRPTRFVLLWIIAGGCGHYDFAKSGQSGGDANGDGASGDGASGDGAGSDGGVAQNVVFVSSTSLTIPSATLLADADAQCAVLGAAAGHPGTYRAWLSMSNESAVGRLGSARGWVRLVDGLPVADQPADLAAGRMFHPVRFNDLGAVATVETMTGTYQGAASSNCLDFTATTGVLDSGDPHSIGESFTRKGLYQNCASSQPVYCFQVDHQVMLAPTPAAGRRIFASMPFQTGNGVSGADVQCTTEAAAAGFPGSFRALLATSTASAASRFNAVGQPWVRPDGVLVAPTAADFLAGNVVAPPCLRANGDCVDRIAFTGADSPQAVGSLTTTCDDWTRSSAAPPDPRVGALQTDGSASFFAMPNTDCSLPAAVYCLQE